MNDLLSNSFSLFRNQAQSPPHNGNNQISDIEMANTTASSAVNLEKFFEDVGAIKEEFTSLESLYTQLQTSHEKSKTLHSAKAVKELRAKMENDISQSLKKAKFIKSQLESLDKSNVAHRNLPDCGPGSSSDRTRTSVVDGLRKKLYGHMNLFNELREKMSGEYKETVQRRYFTVTGENPDENTLETLISTGESETFLKRAIEQQGRGQVMDIIMEIQERHDAVMEIEKNLKELHQVFLDMRVLVESQGEQLDDIESHVQRASSYVDNGRRQLEVARKTQKNTRKWSCFAIILLLIIIAIVVLSIRPWK